KKTMVMETSYAYTPEDTDFWGNTIGAGAAGADYPFTVAGQANFLRDLTDTLVNKTKDAIGLCYWEGTWISVGTENLEKNQKLWEEFGSGWASSYAKEYDPDDAGKWYGGSAVDNQALFDADGKPLESLKVFALLKNGNDAPVYVDGALDASCTMMTDDPSFELPKTVPVVYSDNSKKDAAVTWDAFDLAAARAKGNADYTIAGKAEGYDVVCRLAVREYNYIENDSFEDPSAAPWTLTVNAGTPSNTHKIGVTAENPKTGTYAFHFWTSDAAGVDFDITQDLAMKTSGTYKYGFSVLGGGSGTASVTASAEDVYGYVLIDGEEAGRVPVTITCYANGYRSYLLEGIRYEAGRKLTVGIHVGIAEANCWGDIDDVMFNYVGE
ncbi:MAG: glycosyl hydrolase 53 family protein, partial [Firmicutes bacterium]|nr:glycosyl hydrolase 53 family protein [Bacillota bacterium]